MSQPVRRYRCRYCGHLLPAWIRVPGEIDGAILLGHLSQRHPAEVKPYLYRMHRTIGYEKAARSERFGLLALPSWGQLDLLTICPSGVSLTMRTS